jgi:AcrR family transcriptional regulator
VSGECVDAGLRRRAGLRADVARKYEQRKRAEGVAATRQRIVEATVELHRTVGPAATRITEVARRAGLRRVTVYDHFPDEASLVAACSAHWRALHPGPDPAAWAQIEPPAERLRTGLSALYAWYRETEPMTANVLRDAEAVPALSDVLARGLLAWLAAVRAVFEAPYAAAGGAAPPRVEAAIRLAVDFHGWQALAPLGDAAAADLAADLVEAAARGPRTAPGRGTPSAPEAAAR